MNTIFPYIFLAFIIVVAIVGILGMAVFIWLYKNDDGQIIIRRNKEEE